MMTRFYLTEVLLRKLKTSTDTCQLTFGSYYESNWTFSFRRNRITEALLCRYEARDNPAPIEVPDEEPACTKVSPHSIPLSSSFHADQP